LPLVIYTKINGYSQVLLKLIVDKTGFGHFSRKNAGFPCMGEYLLFYTALVGGYSIIHE